MIIDPPAVMYGPPEAIDAWLAELATYPQDAPEVKAEIEQAQEWLNLAIKRQEYGYTWTPEGVMVPGHRSDNSEDMLGDDILDTDWDAGVEDPPHDRIYAEVDRRAAEAARQPNRQADFFIKE